MISSLNKGESVPEPSLCLQIVLQKPTAYKWTLIWTTVLAPDYNIMP